MKKNDTKDYVGFIFECPSFCLNGSFALVMKAYAERAGQCTVYGIKPNGERCVIESKG